MGLRNAGRCGMAFLLLLGLGTGCASRPDLGDASPMESSLFRGEWFDYYNRGRQRLRAGDTAAAAGDFRKAIAYRPEDTHVARSYGVHLQSYYPHRELGILALREGRYEEAVRHLETSVRQAATPSARHYLNEARAQVIRRQGLDGAPPTIEVVSPVITRQRDFRLEGMVLDDTFVGEVWVGTERQYFELARPEVPVESEVTLRAGWNEIPIRAVDLAGRASETSARVFLDVAGPVLSLSRLVREDTADGRVAVHLSGNIFDEGGLGPCRIGDRLLNAESERHPFEMEFRVEAGTPMLPFRLTDQNGNETEGNIPLPGSAGTGRAGRAGMAGPVRLAFAGGAPPARMLATGAFFQAAGIELHGARDGERVFHPAYYIDGVAVDDDGITEIRINNESLRASEATVFFSYRADLVEGTNTICLEAEDRTGEVHRKWLNIIYEPPSARKQASRLKVAVLRHKFEYLGPIPDDFETMLPNSLIEAILAHRRFRILDREHLEDIETEIAIAEAAGTPGASQEKREPADLLVYARMNDEVHGMDVTLNTVATFNPEEPIPPVRGYYEGRDFSVQQLEWMVEGLYLKFLNRFPLVEGEVVDVKDNTIVTTLNSDYRVHPGQPLYILRPDRTNEPPIDRDVGTARVRRVDDRYSYADILGEAGPVRPEDVVLCK